jgi:hypothetical protein
MRGGDMTPREERVRARAQRYGKRPVGQKAGTRNSGIARSERSQSKTTEERTNPCPITPN